MLIASINRRLTLALTVCSLMALLALGGAEHFRDSEYAAIQKNFQAATASDQLQHQAHKLNEAARGYVSTGQEALLTRYRSESRAFEAFDAQFGHLEHLQLSTDEMQSLLAIYDAISSAIVTQRQAINLARNQDFSAAIALLYSSDYEQALKQIEDPAEQFVRLVQVRFQTEQDTSHQKALLGRIIAMGLGGVNMILLLIGLLFFYRQRVIAPISQLVSDLKQVQDNPNASFQNQDLTNEIGDVVRAIQSYHTTAREVLPHDRARGKSPAMGRRQQGGHSCKLPRLPKHTNACPSFSKQPRAGAGMRGDCDSYAPHPYRALPPDGAIRRHRRNHPPGRERKPPHSSSH